MLAKLRRKNQITIPKAVISAFEGAEYFDVAQDNGTEQDIADAVEWARRG